MPTVRHRHYHRERRVRSKPVSVPGTYGIGILLGRIARQVECSGAYTEPQSQRTAAAALAKVHVTALPHSQRHAPDLASIAKHHEESFPEARPLTGLAACAVLLITAIFLFVLLTGSDTDGDRDGRNSPRMNTTGPPIPPPPTE